MRVTAAFACCGLLWACDAPSGGAVFGPHTGWSGGRSVAEDGTVLSLSCLSDGWSPAVQTIERLVPTDETDQWVNRDIEFQFDNGPVQRAKGTLRETSVLFWQTDASTIQTEYGQDLAAGLLRGNHRTLTIRTTDGSNRRKEWHFDVASSARQIASQGVQSCPLPPVPTKQ
jgi:hypothetical protein